MQIQAQEKWVVVPQYFQLELDIQGGAMNRGLLVAGPPPPPLGGCERKD